jgi:UDP-glucose 4-epimerase
MRLLITGGAGFIGSNLAAHFNEFSPSTEITILDDFSNGRRSNLRAVDANVVEGTILDKGLVGQLAHDAQVIVHLAALGSVPRSVKAPRATHDANVTGTLNVLEAARNSNVSQVIVASSSSVYGSNERVPKSENDYTRPLSPYAVSKQATEAYAIAYNTTYGLNTLALRFFNVFGPNQPADHPYAAVIPRFLDAAFRDSPMMIFGDGDQSRDFTYVTTVCEVVFAAVKKGTGSVEPLNLAFGEKISILDVAEGIELILGRKLERRHEPPRIGDVLASQSDGLRIRSVFPEVAPVPFLNGLRETIDWFREHQVES